MAEKVESRESRSTDNVGFVVRSVRSPFSQFNTTFPMDYAIANAFGEAAVMDTYERCKEWKSDVRYWAELVLTLNTYCWYFNDTGNEAMSKLYADLYYEAHEWALDNYEGDDARYYFEVTD